MLRKVLPESVKCTFRGRLIPGTFTTHPDFPTLRSLQFRHKTKEIGINVFLSRSMLETISLEFPRCDTPVSSLSQYLPHSLIGQIRCTHYPINIPSLVVAISSSTELLPKDFSHPWVLETSPAELRQNLNFHMKFSKGITVKGGFEVLLFVKQMRHIVKKADGSYVYEWDEKLWVFPVELMVERQPEGHHTELPKLQALRDEYPVGEEVVTFLKALYGAKASVVRYGYDRHCEQGSVAISSFLYTTPLDEELTNSLYFEEQFLAIRDICRSVQASARVLSRLLGNLKVKHHSGGSVGMYQLGLDLSNYRDYLHVEGWARWSHRLNGYEYSREVVPMLKAYKERFGVLWHRLEQLQGSKVIKVDVLFPDIKDPVLELKRIAMFVSKLPSARLPWTPDGSHRGSSVPIHRLSTAFKSLSRSRSSELVHTNPALLVMSLPPYIKPYYFEKIDFALGDPVVNINDQDLPYVPFGAMGVVVGTYMNNVIEVVFEGSSGADTTETKVVHFGNLINLNHPYFIPLRHQAAAGDRAERLSDPPKAKVKKVNPAARYLLKQSPSIKPKTDDSISPTKPAADPQHSRAVSEAVPSNHSTDKGGPEEEFKFAPSASEFIPSKPPVFKSPEGAAFPNPFS